MSPDGGVPEHGGFLSPGSWPMAAVVSERVELRGGRSAPTLARTLARERLGPRLDDVRRNDLLLLVTELVTNAVRHGGAGGPDAPVVLHLAAAERVLRVEVCDRGPGFEPVERVPGPDGGFGLLLLRSVPDRWGVANDEGTCVWFEFDVEPLSGPRQGGEPPRR
jgi:anti-sigma regulatory factor (Ser/Thr protein kinase)